MRLNYPSAQPVEIGGLPRWRVLLHNVFVLYRQQFRRWFAITAPTSLAASVVLVLVDQQIRAIFSSIPRGQLQYHFVEIAETVALRFGGFFLAWLLGAFALGAIATAVCNLDSEEEVVWLRDSHQRAREHFGSLLLVAVFTFCAYLLGMLAVGLVYVALTKQVGWARFSRYNFAVALAGTVVVASIVSWFGMAIPLILRGNISVWAALRKSVKLSNGSEGFLFLLVIESLVGSYVGWYAAHYGFALVSPPSIKYAEWYGWLVYFVSVLASAAVQPPMFIGFSLLAQESSQPVNNFQGSSTSTS